MRQEGAGLLERLYLLTGRVRYGAVALSALGSWFC